MLSELRSCDIRVFGGSNPSASKKSLLKAFVPLAQLVRASCLWRGGRGFESHMEQSIGPESQGYLY